MWNYKGAKWCGRAAEKKINKKRKKKEEGGIKMCASTKICNIKLRM